MLFLRSKVWYPGAPYSCKATTNRDLVSSVFDLSTAMPCGIAATTNYGSRSATMNSDEFFHYHLRPRGMSKRYESKIWILANRFSPLVSVGYMQKRYETTILIFLPIASGHNLTTSRLRRVTHLLALRSLKGSLLQISERLSFPPPLWKKISY